MSDSNQRILVAHMVGKAWEELLENEVMITLLFTNIGCGITINSDDDNLIQPQ